MHMQHTNLFWPQWIAGRHKIEKKILMPEMVSFHPSVASLSLSFPPSLPHPVASFSLVQCLVYFRVEVDGRKLYGQNCIPLISLQPGEEFFFSV